MSTNERNDITEAKENYLSSGELTFNDVVNTLKQMCVVTTTNLTDLQKHQNSTTRTIIDSYVVQIKIYSDILSKPDISEVQVKYCFDGINDINNKTESLKIQDDIRVKEDKERWKELGKTILKVMGDIIVTVIIVNGAPTIIKSITKK